MSDDSTVDAQGTSEVQRVYVRSLRELRQGVGCTPERLIAHPELQDALERRLSTRGEAGGVRAAIDELGILICALGNVRQRDALLVALRLNSDFPQSGLTQRREQYNQYLNRAANSEIRTMRVDNIRTLERRENAAIGDVALLLDEKVPVGRSMPEAPATQTEPMQLPNKLVTESISQAFYFSATGAIARKDATVYCRAVGGVSQRADFSTRYYRESRRGVLQVQVLFGCRVVNVQEDVGGGILAHLDILKMLEPADGLYPYAYRVTVNSNLRAEPIVYWQPTGEYIRRVDYQLIFNETMTPIRAWWFNSKRRVEAGIEPPESAKRHLEIMDNGRYVYKSFETDKSTTSGYFGIAWVWPE